MRWVEGDFEQLVYNVSDVQGLKSTADQLDRRLMTAVSNSPALIRNGLRCAFVTFATPGYALGLKVLIRTMREHSRQPIVVITDRRWDFRTDAADVYLIVAPSLYSDRYNPDRTEIRTTLTKLWMFALCGLDRLIFIDADCLVQKPLDDLFDRKGLWCAPDFVENVDSSRFNSGLVAFDPSVELRNRVFEQAYAAPSYDHGDQGLLNEILLPSVNFLPPEYNSCRHYLSFHGPELDLQSVRMIHYIVKKPWELWYRETPDAALVDADDLWTARLTHAELQELVSSWRRRQFLAERPRLESIRQRRNMLESMLSNRRLRYFLAAVVALALGAVFACSLALLLLAIAKWR